MNINRKPINQRDIKSLNLPNMKIGTLTIKENNNIVQSSIEENKSTLSIKLPSIDNVDLFSSIDD